MKNKFLIGFVVLLLAFSLVGAKDFVIRNVSDSTQNYFVVNGSTGNVGIGTTNPTSKLQIDKSFIYDTYGPGSSNLYLVNKNFEGSSGFLRLGSYYGNGGVNDYYTSSGIGGGKTTSAGSGWGGYMSFWTTSGGANGEAASGMYERVRISDSGNVGIGTTDPASYKLNVAGAGAKLRVGPTYNPTDRDYVDIIAHGSDTRVTSSNERFHIENIGGPLILQGSSGNVGIGTINPSSGFKLDVNGNSRIYTNTGTSATASLIINETAGGASELVIYGGNSLTNRRAAIRFYSENISSSTSQWLMGSSISQTSGDDKFSFRDSSNSNILVLEQGGNVGIGTSTPQNELNVVGDLNATGSIYQNGKSLDNTYIKNDGDNATGEYNFDGGWQSGGASIIGGNLYAQALYAYDINALAVSNLNVNGSIVPPTGFDNQFDLGNSTNRWRNGYFGGDLTVDGTINANVSGGVNPGLTTGSVVFQDANGLAEDNTNLFWDDTNNRLGIGTTSPKTQFHLGTETPALSIGSITSYGGSSKNAMSAITSTLSAGGQNGGSLNFQTNSWGTNGLYVPETRMIILPKGNVGIGTTNPSVKLEVNGGNILIKDLSGYGGFIYGYDKNHGIYMREGNANKINYYEYGGTLTSGAGHKFYTGGLKASQTLRLQIADDGAYFSGNVGIGTTNLGQELTVNGQMTFGTNLGDIISLYDNRINGIGMYGLGVESSYMYFKTASGYRWYSGVNADSGVSDIMELQNNGNLIITSGKVGIGTTEPGAKLEVKPTASSTTSVEGIRIYNSGGAIGAGSKIGLGVGASSYIEKGSIRTDIISGGAGRLFLGSNGRQSDLIIDENGDVGIGVGTISPTAKLEVGGSIKQNKIKTYVINSLAASGVQAKRFEIARATINYNNWNSGIGPIIIELFENYFDQGNYKKYIVDWGYNNQYNVHLTEYNGVSDANNVIVNVGPPVLISGSLYYLPIYIDVRYYSNYDVRITTNRLITTTNPPSVGHMYIYESPIGSNIADFTADSTVIQPSAFGATAYCDENGANCKAITSIGGDVVGPASSTDNAIARFDLATGKLIQNSGVTIDDSNNIVTLGKLTVAGITTLNNAGRFIANGNGFYFGEQSTAYRNPNTNIPGVVIRMDESNAGLDETKAALVLYNSNGGLNTGAGLTFASRESVGAGNDVALSGIFGIKETAGTAGAWSSGGLRLWTKNQGNIVEALSIISNGNVGIGISNPGTYKLLIDGGNSLIRSSSSSYTSSFISNTGTGNALTYYDASNGDFAGGDYANVGQYNDLSLRLVTGASAGDIILMPKNGAGNVGIGTASPAGNLHISDSGSYTPTLKLSSTSTGDPIYNLGVGSDVTPDRSWYMTIDNSDSDKLIFGSKASGWGAAGDGDVLTLQTNGKVGIGTITPQGKLDVAGTINQGRLIARPNAEWSVAGASTGAVLIKLPGTVSNYGMLSMQIDVYEYNSNSVTSYICGGHNYGGLWYNYNCRTIGTSSKKIRLGVKNNQYVVVLGEYGSAWSYGRVSLRVISNGGYYSGNMDLGGVYSIIQDNSVEAYTWISADLNDPYTTTSTLGTYVPYTGATSTVNLGAQALTTTGTVTASSFTGAGTGLTGTASSLTSGNTLSINGAARSISGNTGTSYVNAVQIREANLGGPQGAGGPHNAYQPRLGFHWSGVVASSITMENSGRIAIVNNPGTNYENFIAKTITATGGFSGALSGTATNADLLDNIDSLQFLRSDVADTATGKITFSAPEGIGIGGMRGTTTNEQIEMYSKVSIGDPSGWGSFQAAPANGLSVWGGSNFGNDNDNDYLSIDADGTISDVGGNVVINDNVNAPAYCDENGLNCFDPVVGQKFYRHIITVNGACNNYYQVAIMGGDQTINRRIKVHRSYSSNPDAYICYDNDATPGSHVNALLLEIDENQGGWGGQSYWWEVQNWQSAYDTGFADAGHTGNGNDFYVMLLGGTGGMLYYIDLYEYDSNVAVKYSSSETVSYGVAARNPITVINTANINAHRSLTGRGIYSDGSNIGIGDTTPDGTLKLDVEGQVGATAYCDQNGANCKAITSIGGDVVGPSSSTDNAIARFDLATGKLIQNSGVTIDDSWNIITPGNVQIGSYGRIISTSTSYGSIGLNQAKSGYYGVNFGGGISNPNIMYDGSGNGGIYYQNLGLWVTYFRPSNSHLNIMTSGDLGYTLGVSGTLGATGTVTASSFIGAGTGLTGTASSLTAGFVPWSGITSKPTTLSGYGITNFLSTNSAGPIGADSAVTNGHYYVTNGVGRFGQTDGGLYVQAYNSAWVGQIYQDYRTGQISLRGKNAGIWQPWRDVVDSNNVGTYAGDVNGPSSSTDNAIARFDLATGKLIQNSGVTIDDSNNIVTNGGLTLAGTFDPNGAITLPTTGISGAGSGSGLDADLLDSQSGNYYNTKLYTNKGNEIGSYLGGHYSSGGNEKPNGATFGAGKLKIAMLSGNNLGFGGAWNDVLWLSAYNGGDVKSSHALVFDKYSNNVYVSDQNYDSASWGTGYKLWHEGNDGPNSGLDADLLDGYNSSDFALASSNVDGSGTANYIPKWSDANTLTNSVIYDDGTNVGIGTTAPLGDVGDLTLGSNAGGTYDGKLNLYGTTAGKYSTIKTTNGNLHLDADNTGNFGVLLNYYGGSGGVSFGNGASTIVGSVSSTGDADFDGELTVNKGSYSKSGTIANGLVYCSGGINFGSTTFVCTTPKVYYLEGTYYRNYLIDTYLPSSQAACLALHGNYNTKTTGGPATYASWSTTNNRWGTSGGSYTIATLTCNYV